MVSLVLEASLRGTKERTSDPVTVELKFTYVNQITETATAHLAVGAGSWRRGRHEFHVKNDCKDFILQNAEVTIAAPRATGTLWIDRLDLERDPTSN
ncbi:MAG: hypothetical protein EXS18_04615 [Verrucomicrobiae bacterium]|nr:hypothetical protein [Verrucomicrobiae bacterium]